jgi:hypothetical protein
VNSRAWIVRLDRLLLWGIALAIAVMLQPWWLDGFRVGFFATALCTLGQIVTAHLLPQERA